eukprot:1160477-Pelagomonas_calceolata.AAC.11
MYAVTTRITYGIGRWPYVQAELRELWGRGLRAGETEASAMRCVCVCACVCGVCVCVHMYVRVHVHVCVCMRACVQTSTPCNDLKFQQIRGVQSEFWHAMWQEDSESSG